MYVRSHIWYDVRIKGTVNGKCSVLPNGIETTFDGEEEGKIIQF